MKKISSVLVLVLSLCAFSVYSQERGAQLLLKSSPQTTLTPLLTTPETPAPVVAPAAAPAAPETNRVSALVSQKSKVSYSIRSRGFLQNPKTGAVLYEVLTLRERGLWGNGSLTQLLVNDEGQPVAVLNSSASAGPGIALIQGASFVGGMYLFAEHLRPPKQNVNSGNSNSGNSGTGSGNGTTVNNSLSSTANGGAGGAGGSANATGGAGGVASATGGNATSSATGGSATSSANNTGAGSGQSVIVNSGNANGNGDIILGGSTAPAAP